MGLSLIHFQEHTMRALREDLDQESFYLLNFFLFCLLCNLQDLKVQVVEILLKLFVPIQKTWLKIRWNSKKSFKTLDS